MPMPFAEGGPMRTAADDRAARPPQLASHITELLRLQALARPDATAIISPAARWTYRTWLEEAQKVAAALSMDGVGPGDTVALLAPNRAEWLAVAFGCAAIGARLAAFNTWLKRPELEQLLLQAAPKAFVVADRWGRQDFLADLEAIMPEVWAGERWAAAAAPGLQRLVIMGARAPAGATTYDEWRSVEPWTGDPVSPADGVALVLFTSGSTAQPKGVTLTHTDLIANGYEIGERMGIGTEDRLLLLSPLFWALGSANALFATLTHGTCLMPWPRFEPAETLATIERERCTAIYTLSAITHALVAHEDFTPARVASLQRGLTFGPPAEMRLAVDRLGVSDICNIYGSTEVYGNCAVSPWWSAVESRLKSSGPALPGVEIRIVDPKSGAEQRPGAPGEIWVRGRVSPGYVTADGSTVAVADADGWFHTGDLGTLDASGWLTFVSRISEMIKTSGINVSPAEVEAVLCGHEAVLAAAVTGVDHPVKGQEVVAFVRVRPGHHLEPEELRRWATERSASYKVPARVVMVDDFPTTGTGKLARRQLAALAGGAALAGTDPEADRAG